MSLAKTGTSRRTLLQQAAALAGAAAASSLLPAGVRNAVAQTVSPAPSPASVSPAPSPASWISTTATSPWQQQPLRPGGWRWDTLNTWVDLTSAANPSPAIEGFGGCFNELGWTSLQALPADQQESIFKELFAPGAGANFTLCRMPIGANDFSRGWYSYDEHPDDFALEHFSIDNDLQTLVPFIKSAQRHNPSLELWASPWSPPSWMKRNGHYAVHMQRPGLAPNGLKPDQVGKEGEDLFIQDDKYFKTYAQYFGRFIDAYRQQGISIGMVMPQNEFNSAQPFPSCTWTPAGLARFLRFLGPEMSQRNVEIFFGTLERGNETLLEAVLADPDARDYVKGVGVQWAGKGAVAAIHAQHPSLTLYQSEQECGDGKNDWAYAGYCWDLMKYYLRNGASGYMYGNISVDQGGESHWGWPQNSLISVDPQAKTFHFNHDYYLLKHVSHFVQRGAKRLDTRGTCDDALAFLNPDRSVVVILRNESAQEKAIDITIGDNTIRGSMPPDSFNTMTLSVNA
jgi:glucosylceramidase